MHSFTNCAQVLTITPCIKCENLLYASWQTTCQWILITETIGTHYQKQSLSRTPGVVAGLLATGISGKGTTNKYNHGIPRQSMLGSATSQRNKRSSEQHSDLYNNYKRTWVEASLPEIWPFQSIIYYKFTHSFGIFRRDNRNYQHAALVLVRCCPQPGQVSTLSVVLIASLR